VQPKLLALRQEAIQAPHETSVPRVFAIGDVRAGSEKRVGATIMTARPLWRKFMRTRRQHMPGVPGMSRRDGADATVAAAP
jgi:hypothetical protein